MGEVQRHDEIQGEIIHEYDGIEEADNELPNWWLVTFYGAIVFAVFYWFAYHEYDALPLPMAAYSMELEEQAAQGGGEVTADSLVAMLDDPSAISEGQATFVATCAACHENNGGGKIGPNLTDEHWIHGGSPTDMYATVHDGVLEKGMPAWGASLGAGAVKKVVAYLLTIQNTNVAGGKEAEGEVWRPEGEGGEAAPAEGEGGEEAADGAGAPDAADGEAGETAADDEVADDEETGEQARAARAGEDTPLDDAVASVGQSP